MSRSKRLTDADRMEIVREAAKDVSTSVLAERFGVSVRAIQYTLKADAERQTDTAIPVSAVAAELICHDAGSPGRVFKMDEDSVIERLMRIDEITGGAFVWTDTAGLRQVQRNRRPDPDALLQSAFGEIARHGKAA